MNNRTLALCGGMLLSVAALFGGCNDVVSGKDCKVQCQDVDNTCVQKCNNDDQCKTTCKTDLDNCTASCASVTATPPNPDGGK